MTKLILTIFENFLTRLQLLKKGQIGFQIEYFLPGSDSTKSIQIRFHNIKIYF
jgi:hypothetical protein